MKARSTRSASRARWESLAVVILAASAARCAADVDTVAPAPTVPVAPTAPTPTSTAPETHCVGPSCLRQGHCVAGQASAQFRSQNTLPSVVPPSTRLPVTVTFANCSGAYWSRGAFALVPVELEEGVVWGVRRVELPADIPDGYEVTLQFELLAPLATGRYPARWAISHDRVEVFQEHTPEQDVQVLAPADCALPGPPVRFRSQVPPPEFVGVGSRVRASVTFGNCSSSTLSAADGWSLGSRSDPDDTWGARRIALPGDVPYGAEVTVDIDVVAPSRPGRYPFSWQIMQNDAGVGEVSPVVTPTVLTTVDCSNGSTPARFVRQSAPPGTLDPNQTVDVQATFGNCSEHVWDASYHLDSALGGGAHPWGAGPVNLPLPVGVGFAIEVPFRVHAPGTPGTYGYRWGITGPDGLLEEASPPMDLTVRCIPQCGDHNCGGDGCGGSCGGCGDGWSCDGAHCQPPDRPVCGELQWWNSYITYEHISSGWHDTDLGVRSGTRVQLRHTSRLERHGVYGWGFMPEFTDLATGARFRMLHLHPQQQWATDDGRVYPAGYVVGLSGGDTYDTGLGTWSTGAHLCIQTLRTWGDAFPRGSDACR